MNACLARSLRRRTLPRQLTDTRQEFFWQVPVPVTKASKRSADIPVTKIRP